MAAREPTSLEKDSLKKLKDWLYLEEYIWYIMRHHDQHALL